LVKSIPGVCVVVQKMRNNHPKSPSFDGNEK
jgi:hypothetical protein